ncbi:MULTISPECIES: molybdenum cofactor guanylyltransferase [Niastella]|uniref:Molybdenum cofactor guanylyltransferase n=1 Tax=Niastella soli TaxID=2821487 RepID=A0ABS3YLQ2_9BACT|nr:molybdenum cofactor guanylyltransferase [Niastella soli]MBO9198801.1 molybdenum cofactor guanylyltransferase [Niastella soli]
MENLLGVILCGGESKRMGSDKGLLPIRNTIWAKHMHEKLAMFHLPVVYSVNQHQVSSYCEEISPELLVVDNYDAEGPIKGLLSVHQQYPDKNLLLLACDMLDLDASTIHELLQEYQRDNQSDFYVYQDVNFAQPFCGIYTRTGLEKVAGRIMIGRLKNYSMQAIFDEGVTVRLPIRTQHVFRNYNSIADIEMFFEHPPILPTT